jgi:ribosomal-protein-alanine N-acetyltransferase
MPAGLTTEIFLGDMRPGDLAEVERIAAAVLPWSRQAFVAELARPVSRCRVARTEPGGPVRGYAIWWLVIDEQHLLAIATDPAWQRRGIARALLEDMLVEGAVRGARTCFLEVRPSNAAALALYRAYGFETIDVRRHYYADGEDAWIMARSASPPT